MRRKAFSKAIQGTNLEFQALGIEMNQRDRSSAVYQAGQGEMPALQGDLVLDHTRSTYPGCRVPHVWLDKAIPRPAHSILDLAGKGRFTLLTGIGGDAWKQAAVDVEMQLRIPIVAYSIGFRQDWEDVYFNWEIICEVEEDGCVLIRPDRYVAWRSLEWSRTPSKSLLHVFTATLSLVQSTLSSREVSSATSS